MAGIVPAIILFFACAVIRDGLAFQSFLVSRSKIDSKWLIPRLFLVFGSLACIWSFVGYKAALTVSGYFIVYLLMIAVYSIPTTWPTPTPIADKMGKFGSVLIVPILIIWVGISVYTTAVYPNLPQEFGGMLPRRAYLDLKRAELSPETQGAILPRKRYSPLLEVASPIVRTLPLDVLYETSDFLLVRPAGTTAGAPVYKIKKELAQIVEWHNSDAPAMQRRQAVSATKSASKP